MSATTREALAELAKAESHYRLIFQTAPSADHLDVGRAWDRMRKAGDVARAALAQPAPTDAQIAELFERWGLGGDPDAFVRLPAYEQVLFAFTAGVLAARGVA